MNNTKKTAFTAKSSFIVFKDSHFAELTDLSVDAIKKTAKEVVAKSEQHKSPVRTPIKQSSALNWIANSLGIKGGFADYQQWYDNELTPFLKNNGLINRKDLFSFRRKAYCVPLKTLTRQKLSERIFFGGKPPVHKVFTGYNFPFDTTFDDGHFLVNGTYNVQSIQKLGIKRRGPTLPNLIEEDIKIIKDIGSKVLTDLPRGFGNRTVKDVVTGKYLMDLDLCFNLIGDNGEFDFIYKNMRDDPFIFNFHNGSLKLTDLPTSVPDYKFAQWYYFEYQGQRDLDSHQAEQLHYESGGTTKDYPVDFNHLLADFYEVNELYSSKIIGENVPFNKLDGFNPVEGTNLLVSDLISISEFRNFLDLNRNYQNYRKETFEGEHELKKRSGVDINNLDSDTSLPAACTYYDALAYACWKSKQTKAPIRLLTQEEYICIRKQGNLLDWPFDSEKHLSLGIKKPMPVDMDVENLQNLPMFNMVKFPKNVPWVEINGGTRFILLNYFAEWALEGTCVRSGSCTSFYGDDIYRDTNRATTGAYKNTKIGFRLCYEVNTLNQ
ncbi:SUMF1/EgtB/PvdO family nonheme iron enzyme [Thalassotalea profundi]|uniref:Sulfatase-modifying factor enzyme domain-containing protein n=1 Tax=Thalassotalea profundi TaxID=2036687 RepID=A0ABQ3IWB4_9GAMM|nr:SUMF1/EgtB/PvdO family nonheme iron enzyme [Thalassotalea profundi]GHE96756.1 hypothetical protein GCM10011501_27820 [Thalassotalea profundi]